MTLVEAESEMQLFLEHDGDSALRVSDADGETTTSVPRACTRRSHGAVVGSSTCIFCRGGKSKRDRPHLDLPPSPCRPHPAAPSHFPYQERRTNKPAAPRPSFHKFAQREPKPSSRLQPTRLPLPTPVSPAQTRFRPQPSRINPPLAHSASTMADVASAPNANQQVPLDSIPISPSDNTSSGESKEQSATSATSDSDIRTVFHDAENFNVKHPLMNTWTLWFTKPPSGKARLPPHIWLRA